MFKAIRRPLKITLSLFLCLIMFLSVAGCANDSANVVTTGGSLPNTQTHVWTVSGTEKILRDFNYSDNYGDNTLKISAFRNENAAGQIIITPLNNTEYTVETADLRNSSGDVLSKNCFTVFHQKYMDVKSLRNYEINTSTGYYPDALLPYANAVEYGQNKIDGKRNQGIWINLKVPKATSGSEQPAGLYTGNFLVKVGGVSYNVPVEIELYDYTLSDVTNGQSCFMMCWYDLDYGEGDVSREMQETYYNFMLDHRLSPSHFPGFYTSFNFHERHNRNEVYLDYCKQAEKYSLDPRCSNYGLLFEGAMSAPFVSPISGETVTVNCVDEKRLAEFLTFMAEYSVEHEVNLFKKAYTYAAFFDEYDSFAGRTDMANYNLDLLNRVCKETAEKCAVELSCDNTEFFNELLYDLEHITHLIVGNITANLIASGTTCSTINVFHSQDGRNNYHAYAEEHGTEVWTYTANNPVYPYPNYQTEVPYYSSRVLGWMMYDYDLVGNLYWDSSHNRKGGNGILQDYYGGDPSRWGGNANGDGYLMYAGRQYGVYGPVASIRLKAILDGNEDYDLLHALEQFYVNRGLTEADFDSVYDLISKDLYNGTKVNQSVNAEDILAKSRDKLAKLLVMADKANTLIDSCEISNGQANVKVSAPEGAEVIINGQELAGDLSNGIVNYSKVIPLNQNVNTLSLSVKYDGKNYSTTLDLGKKQQAITANQLQNKAEFLNAEAGNITLEQKNIDGENYDLLKISFTKFNDTFKSNSMFMNTTAPLVIDQNVNSISIRIYNEDDQAFDLTISSLSERFSDYIPIITCSLKKGWNDIYIDAKLFNCQSNGKVNKLRFLLQGTSAVASKNIYLHNIVWEGA